LLVANQEPERENQFSKKLGGRGGACPNRVDGQQAGAAEFAGSWHSYFTPKASQHRVRERDGRVRPDPERYLTRDGSTASPTARWEVRGRLDADEVVGGTRATIPTRNETDLLPPSNENGHTRSRQTWSSRQGTVFADWNEVARIFANEHLVTQVWKPGWRQPMFVGTQHEP